MRKIKVVALAVSSLLILQFVTACTSSPKEAKTSEAAAAPTIPITLPVAQNGKITFANAAANFALIPSVAWQQTQDLIASNKVNNIPTVIHVGPNTNASSTAITNGLDRLNKLFGGFMHVPSYTGIVYNAKDQEWAQSDAAEYFKSQNFNSSNTIPENIKQLVQAGCEMNGSTAVNCGGGMAWDFRDGNNQAGGAYYGVQSDIVNGAPATYWTDANKFAGPMTQVNHEGTHNYQITQFFFTPLGKNQNISADLMHAFGPWWFSEGHANAIGISSFIDNLKDYKSVRDNTVTNRPGPNASVPSMTADGIKKFLTSTQAADPSNPNWLLAYSMGMAAVEALSAIGGPQSTLALYALGAKGEDWNTAFKNVYGITWDEGSTVLANVLAAEYKAKPMGK
jgi:hypothetical protein